MKEYAARNPVTFPVEPCPLPQDGCRNFAVIPVYDENDFLPATLASLKRAIDRAKEAVRVVLVINAPVNAPESALRANETLLSSLRKSDGKSDGGLSVGSELFFIDLKGSNLPDKFRNVGNARKTGFDACYSESDGLFFSLDADTLVNENYISAVIEHFQSHPGDAGAVLHFAHRLVGDEATQKALMRYELWLRDYARKCRETGSFYGFWTIGSCFAVRMSAYAKCGGMRRRSGGEDFYFLQALRKVGHIGVVSGTAVFPSGRVSKRVPFGTGPALAKQLEGETLKFYNPAGFALLKPFFAAAKPETGRLLCEEPLDFAPEPLKQFLMEQGFPEAWRKIKNNTPKTAGKLEMALQTYCDGFFILKFLHWLEALDDKRFGRMDIPDDVNLSEALERARNLDREMES